MRSKWSFRELFSPKILSVEVKNRNQRKSHSLVFCQCKVRATIFKVSLIKGGEMKILILSGHVGHLEDYLVKVKENHKRFSSLHGYDYLFVDDFDFNDEYVDDSPAITFTWLKAAKTLELMKSRKYDYIFGIDSDSIFWKLDKNLDDLISLNKDFVFTGDSWDLFNGGHFLVRSSSWSIEFFENWLSMRSVRDELLNTSHKGKTGLIMDQPAMNVLLSSGTSKHFNFAKAFNEVNGYIHNENRRHKWFHLTHAPTSRLRLVNSRRLVHPTLRNNVGIVIQERLNAYPFNLPGKKANPRKSDILHFPGESKFLLKSYSDMVER